jgi:hypothetical protein
MKRADYRQAYNAAIHALAELRGIMPRLARDGDAAQVIGDMIAAIDRALHDLSKLPRE